MSNTQYDLYQSKTIVLAKTMVLKLNNVALNINADLVAKGYTVDTTRPETWKYYLNLNGEYHQYDKDRLLELSDNKHDQIRIKIAGDNQSVETDFNKGLLYGDLSDLTIANEYRFNTQYYNALLDKYPEFNALIRGVLNPIPIATALDAYEGQILYCGGYMRTYIYNKYQYILQDYGPISENFLIESNELNLIPDLQDEIDLFIARYFNQGYYELQSLWYPTFLGQLYLHAMHCIQNIRLKNIKSPLGFTHSFLIQQYLDSNGNMGWITPYLSKGVTLWLYRNWMWLDANKGKQMTMQAIVDNVLTPENIPLSGYRLNQNIRNMKASLVNGSDVSSQPDPFFQREVINFKHSGSGSDQVQIEDMVDEEKYLAKDNFITQADQIKDVRNASRYSIYDTLNTKILESTVIDLSNNIQVTIDDIALNYWLLTATQGWYRGTVIATNPATNERVQMTPLSAFILALYCLNKGWANYTLKEIPTLPARWIPKLTNWKPSDQYKFKPSLADMKYGTTSDHITESQILDIMGNFTPVLKHGSAISLGNEVVRIHSEAMRQYMSYTGISDAIGRGQGEFVSHQQWWWDVPCQLAPTGTLYSDWLVSHGFNIGDFTRDQFVQFGLNIVDAAVTINEDTANTIQNKQNAALAVLRHFCSYTVQIIQNAVSNDSIMMGSLHTRVTNDKVSAASSESIELPKIDLEPMLSVSEKIINIDGGNKTDLDIDISVNDNIAITSPSLEVDKGNQSTISNIELVRGGITDIDIPEVVIDTRVKVYSNLTSQPFVKFAAEQVTANMGVTNVTLTPPMLPKPKETATVATSFLDIETMSSISDSETLHLGSKTDIATQYKGN